jgi:LEA14-like dessication related protein
LAIGAALAEWQRMRFVVLTVAMLTGCSLFMHSIEKPSAEVRGVSVSSAGFTGVTGELALDVMNPNSFGVPLSGIDWQLSIGGTRAVTGTVQLSQTIPAKGVAPVKTSLSIAASDAIIVGSVLARGARNYQLTAKLHFSTTVGQVDVDIVHAGELSQPVALR